MSKKYDLSKIEVDPEIIVGARSMTVEKVKEFTTQKYSASAIKPVKYSSNVTLPKKKVKRSIKHLAGKEITKEQAAIIPKLGGNYQLFYLRQIKMLIENDLIDREDETVIKLLEEMNDLLPKVINKRSK